jgi:hypothetical protein
MPFTVEIWFKPLSNSKVTIVGHDDDGLTYDPITNMVTWTIRQSDGTFISTSQPGSSKVMYLVGQYTGYSVVLYVDGVSSSAFTSLPITSTGPLRTGAGKMSVDALAFYDYLLDDAKMQSHYYEGTNFPSINAVYAEAENYFDLTDNSEEVLLNISFSDWSKGYFEGSVVNQDGVVVNDIGITDGLAYFSIILPDEDVLQGAKISYQYLGTPPVVEVTTDETTWTAVTNNALMPGVSAGTAMGTVDPLIRVILKETTQLTDLRVVVYKNNQSIGLKSSNYLEITRPAVSAFEQMYPYEQDTFGGANVTGGSLTLKKTTDDVVAAISFWYKGDEPTGGVKNGGTGHLADQWNFCYKENTTFTLTGYTGRIANFATWSQTQVPTVLYSKHFAKPTLRVIDSDKITITEPDNGVRVSQKNWIMI